jgi:uncharacterized SAM-binding protein YcdF (DUF218 family)
MPSHACDIDHRTAAMMVVLATWLATTLLLSTWRRPWSKRGGAAVAGFAVAGLSMPGGAVLEKSIGILLLPTGLVWFMVGLAAAAMVAQRCRGGGAMVALWVVLGVVGNEPLGQWCMSQLEEPFGADPLRQGKFDAVVVLGGGASSGPNDQVELGPAGDRIVLGARLYLRGQTPLLVTTGTAIAGFQSPLDSTVATTMMWRDLGIPAEAIVPVGNTTTTREEATQVAALVRARGWQRVGLLTSAWHLRRAVRLFTRAGVEVVPIAADHRGSPTWNGLYSMIPTGTGSYHLQKAGWEWLGYVVGK